MGRSGRRGGLGGLPAPLVVLCAGIMRSSLLLLLAPQKWQLVCGLLYNILLFIIALTALECSYF